MRTGWLVSFVFVLIACGDNKKAPPDAAPDTATATCGNSVVEGVEQCDEGTANGTQGGRCSQTCQWTCLEDFWCADADPCNGAETCVDHACVAGTPEADGVSCGTGKICRNTACTDGVCGDMFVTAPEECDDSNSTPGDGCEGNCKYSCLSTDTARNCTPVDPCQGQGTCNDNTHVCTPGTPLMDNTSCGTGKYCKMGVCTTAMCGNGMVEPGEICDLGTQNGVMGSGCKSNCQYECVTATTDCPAAPFCQMPSCNTAHACANVPDPAKNGMTCGTNLICNNGACVPPTSVCGNGVTEAGEQCDFGMGNNGPGTGCENSCQFSCTIMPDSCNDNNPCNGTETCTMVTVNMRPGQRCTSTAAPAAGTACGTGRICLGMVCVMSMCGDGFVSMPNGEQCEPANTATCSATCRNIVCGNGVREGTEQCDDGNTINLDACSSTCKFEQCHRVNSLSMQFGTDMFCTANQLGSAIGGLAQGTIGTALTNGVNDGSITIELFPIGLDDLSGTNDTSMSLGILTGTPVAGTGYNGAMDLDWWYTTAASVINASRVPTTQTPAMIMNKTLTSGPSEISITISLGGVPATLNMLAARMRGNIGAVSTPLTSTGSTPGHLASEHLDPALQSYATMTNGQLCGNVTAGSLAQVPIPAALLQNCTNYTTANSLLDVIVGGCIFIFPIINPRQPDQVRSGMGLFTLMTNSMRQVTSCTRNSMSVPLMTCLNDAAYSSSFRFTTDRVIAK